MPAPALLLAALLCGCAPLAPGTAAPSGLALPATWTRGPMATEAASLASWWTRFNDPQLGALVEQALQANTSVAGAEAALRQARALHDVALAGLAPTLAGTAAAQRSLSGGQVSGNVFRTGLDANWNPDPFGLTRSTVAASEASLRASAASLGDAQVAVAAEVALQYIALRSGQARLTIARRNLDAQLETLQLTQWRLQAGLVTSLEGEQARAAAEQTRAQLPALQTGIAQATHALAVLSGRPPGALAAQLAEPAPLPQAGAELTASLPAETLRQRPDVRAAEQQVLAAAARLTQAERARLPSLRLGGSLGTSALSLGALGGSGTLLGALLANASLPLLDGGAARAQARAQQAALEQATAAYRATVLTALQEVEDGLVALQSDRTRLLSLQQAAEAAGLAALLARQRYASGLVDFQTVLDTQRNQLSTQDAVAGASASVAADHVRLYKALGGGWRAETENGVPAASARTPRS